MLSILELLRKYRRVLYLDIDIHHGDGVEEAFYTTNRVLSCSFHKFGNYFPDTGNTNDNGTADGAGYAVNYPLNDGIDDDSYRQIFKPVMSEVMANYQPEAIVLQCGTDSLSGDRLGCFNLSVEGHGECVQYMKNFNVPMLVLGGGGYTLRNVARCWAYETSILCDEPVPSEIPMEDKFVEYYGPEYKLHVAISNMENLNTREELQKKTEYLCTQVKQNVYSVAPAISHYAGNELFNTVNGQYSSEAEAIR